MRIRLARLCLGIAGLLLLGVIVVALLPPRTDHSAQVAVEAARQSLRQQGFKTDLADFDFSTSPAMRAREAVLMATAPNPYSQTYNDHPNLMETVGDNSVVVVWKQNSLKLQTPSWPGNRHQLSWAEFRQMLASRRSQIDAACAVAMSGQIRFNLNANAGEAMKLPYLAVLKNLTLTLSDRAMMDLHDGNQSAAWTNLVAATRLVTAWNPVPAEVSHLVRFSDAKIVYNTLWQALQSTNWTDTQLLGLQQTWESADFFSGLPEIAAFKRASYLKASDDQQKMVLESRPTFAEFLRTGFRFPQVIWSELHERWSQEAYLRHGHYEEKIDLMRLYRDREIELRNAIHAPTWAQMRLLPGVTNPPSFHSPYPSRLQSIINLHRIQMGFMWRGAGLLGRAAQTETERRIIITAIALERYRTRHGSYPDSLSALAPDFLKVVPSDFMNGQPLHYRRTDDGHFILYSVGLDCVDNGGRIQPRMGDANFVRPAFPGAPPPESDIVWPRPAAGDAVQGKPQGTAQAGSMR